MKNLYIVMTKIVITENKYSSIYMINYFYINIYIYQKLRICFSEYKIKLSCFNLILLMHY
jgi:hypothetical protein